VNREFVEYERTFKNCVIFDTHSANPFCYTFNTIHIIESSLFVSKSQHFVVENKLNDRKFAKMNRQVFIGLWI
jgi:hypothetical protein